MIGARSDSAMESMDVADTKAFMMMWTSNR